MNDWLDYKGSGSNRYYLSHGIFALSLARQQEIADARLQQAQEIKKSLTIT